VAPAFPVRCAAGIPVVVQDESEMFFEGAFTEAGLPLDYANFSLRFGEAELPQLVKRLRAISPERILELRRAALWVRDYFVYKDMYNPSASRRADLLATGRQRQDAFLLLALALEGRARALGKLRDTPDWRERNLRLLGFSTTSMVLVEGRDEDQTSPSAAGKARDGGVPRRMLRGSSWSGHKEMPNAQAEVLDRGVEPVD